MIRNNIRAFFRQIELEIKSAFRYRFAIISDILVFSILMGFFIGSNTGMSFAQKYHYADHKSLMLAGYLAWTLSIAALSGSVQTVGSELEKGTFYKKINSKCSLTVLMFGSLLVTMMIEMLVVGVLLLLAYLIWHISVPFTLVGIATIGINVVGMYGIGLILGGLCIKYKRVGSITLIIQLALLFLTNTIPTGETLLLITRIIPLTSCNDILKSSITGKIDTMAFLMVVMSSVLWLVLGEIILRISIKSAKKCGNLLLY